MERIVSENVCNESMFDSFASAENMQHQSIFSKLHGFLQDEELSDVVKEPLNKNKGEILMMLLQYAIKHALSQTAVTQLFKLINCMFVAPILPDTSYLIDQLFNPSKIAKFHGMCPDCGIYVGTFERSSKTFLKCNICNTDVEVNSLSYNDFFVNFDVSYQLSELIASNSEYFKFVMSERIYEKDVFKDIYDGRKYRQFLENLNSSDREKYITVNFNTDGAPLFESSSYSIWPIFLQVNELPFHVRSSELIVAGLWFGKSKPNMNIFLKPFVESINKLFTDGFKCNIDNHEITLKVYPVVCCVDSVARASLHCCMLFNGKYGCPWCLHPGEWVSNPLNPNSGSHKYPLIVEEVNLRNVENTVEHMFEGTDIKPCFGFKGPSPLINLKDFDIIEGFVPDPLHLFSGIGKQFANVWFGSKNKSSGLVSKQNVEKINEIMKNLKAPSQIGRLCRTLDDKAFWKGKEWENWILYYSIPIIQMFLKKNLVKHWLLLVEAVYILSREKITLLEIEHADVLLHQFVGDIELLYSSMLMTFNVHQLLHLATSVLNWGPLWAHSAYGFESGNGDLLEIIHAAKGIHHQVCRHIGLKCSLITIKRKVYQNSSATTRKYIDDLCQNKVQKSFKMLDARYYGEMSKVNDEWSRILGLSNNAVAFKKMVRNGCLYLSNIKINKRSDNTFVRLKNRSHGNIVSFVIDKETKRELVILQMLKTNPMFLDNHLAYQKVIKIDKDVEAKNIEEIDTICIYITINNQRFICPVANTLSY